MRRAIVLALMAVASSNAAAGYEKIIENATDGGFTVYVHKATIRKNGTTVRMGSLLDYKVARASPDGRLFQSSKTMVEYECEAHKSRLLAFSTYSRNMGAGEVTSSGSSIEQWSPIEPVSTGELLWQVACGKR